MNSPHAPHQADTQWGNHPTPAPQIVYVAAPPQPQGKQYATVTRHGTSFMGQIGHVLMLLMTCGLWYPMYRRAKRTSRHY